MSDIYVITREFTSDDKCFNWFKVLDEYYLDRDTAIKRIHEKVDACESILKRKESQTKITRDKTDICDKVLIDDPVLGHEERIFRLERLSCYQENEELA